MRTQRVCDYSNHGRVSARDHQESLFGKETVSCRVTDGGRLHQDVSLYLWKIVLSPSMKQKMNRDLRD